VEREQIEAIIESLLFASGEPLSLKKMQEIISEAEKKDVRLALEELIKKWDMPECGLRIVDVAGGYQFQTSSDNAQWVGRMLQSRPVRLSRPSLETLAIVAYRQPVTKAEIEDVRGVDSGGVLKTLLEYGFIRIAGRKDVPGKPLIYATEKRFMEFFCLKSLAELPTLKELEEIQEERIAEVESEGGVTDEDPSGPDETIDTEQKQITENGAEQEKSPEPEQAEEDNIEKSEKEKAD
jgi:segregation and condensation protein B